MLSTPLKHVHLIGIGGINMSAVAKLLRHAGTDVSGSDATRSELTDELASLGIPIVIGHAAENVAPETELVVYSSAVPESNPERTEAHRRGLRQLTNFEFLGEWTAAQRTVLVSGTHGKSTTTAMLGLLCESGGLDPTVIVGSRVPSFPDKNLRLGKSDLVVIEGDEYARHFLAFKPRAVLLNNIELDHTDVFPDLGALLQAFRELLSRVEDNGLIVANADDPQVGTLIGEERGRLEARGIRIRTFGFASHADSQIMDATAKAGEQTFVLRNEHGLTVRYSLRIPGRMNVMNAAGAVTMATVLGVPPDAVPSVLASFKGIWRRFEKVAEKDDVIVVSDYAHHPTAVRATLDGAKAFYPNRRLVLAFQPHHRNRARELFLDFIPCFDRADALILAEIYDVTGRDAPEDQAVTSRDLKEAVMHHDADRGASRSVEYAANPKETLALLKRSVKPGDLVIVMGAGDIYQIATKIL